MATRRVTRVRAVLVGGLVLAGGIGYAGFAPAAIAAGATVTAEPGATCSPAVTNPFCWQPTSVTIGVNNQVQWVDGGTGAPHRPVGNSDWHASGTCSGANIPCALTFTQAGDFTYKCVYHSYMVGTIHVVGAASSPSPAASVSPGPASPSPSRPSPTPTVAHSMGLTPPPPPSTPQSPSPAASVAAPADSPSSAAVNTDATPSAAAGGALATQGTQPSRSGTLSGLVVFAVVLVLALGGAGVYIYRRNRLS
ncbi:MAG: cupredoxin domain-containing protein [Candidatus Dormibacteria bacterium]